MADALAAADIVVGRAGSSTLAELAAAGTPMVIVPYPHAAGHQAENVTRASAAGAAIIIEDDAFDGDALLRVADLLSEPGRLAAMRAGARSLARPGAADAVARLVVAVARRESLPDRAAIERLAVGAG
jgi:UDP-N-acetylglucosamine--N-acetylmuramyl-(pentapeptide) pyrophosphoryl-undecaprenol N-acetylglucosamine transferase